MILKKLLLLSLFSNLLFMAGLRAQTAMDSREPYNPVNMESRLGIDFDSYYFVAENKFFAFRPGFYYGLPGKRHLMGITFPVVHSIFSSDFAGFENTTGIGDIKFTYIGVPIQKKDALGLQRISTFMEVTAPTGNEQLGRGTGAWVFKPGVVFTYRLDPAFYLFPQINFQFSSARLNSLGGGDGVPDPEDQDKEDKLQVLSINIPATFVLDEWSGWISLNPEYIQSFAEDAYFIFLRLDLGKMIGERTSAALNITKFIAGQPRLETMFKVRVNFFLDNQRR
ncbi:MAG: transporter [Cyclobacteriaceae bacterium]|nr:transporter [Cyclobacteriaceae bacterium]